MSTGEVTSKHTNLCLGVSSRSSSRAPAEVTLLPSTLAQCYLNFGIHFAFFGRFTLFYLKLEGAAELNNMHDIQCCIKQVVISIP